MTYSEVEVRRWTNELSCTFGCTAALQRLRSLEFPSSTPDSCRSTISLSIALCKSHAKAMSGGLAPLATPNTLGAQRLDRAHPTLTRSLAMQPTHVTT